MIVAETSDYDDATSFRASLSGVYLYYQRTTDDTWTAPVQYAAYTEEQLYSLYDGEAIDLGDCTFVKSIFGQYNQTGFYCNITGRASEAESVYLEGYTTYANFNTDGITKGITGFNHTGTATAVCIIDTDCNDMTAEEFKTYVTGKKLYYKASGASSWAAPVWDELSYLTGEIIRIGKDAQGQLYALDTPVTKSPTMPAITDPTGYSHFDTEHADKPDWASVSYLSRSVSLTNGGSNNA